MTNFKLTLWTRFMKEHSYLNFYLDKIHLLTIIYMLIFLKSFKNGGCNNIERQVNGACILTYKRQVGIPCENYFGNVIKKLVKIKNNLFKCLAEINKYLNIIFYCFKICNITWDVFYFEQQQDLKRRPSVCYTACYRTR